MIDLQTATPQEIQTHLQPALCGTGIPTLTSGRVKIYDLETALEILEGGLEDIAILNRRNLGAPNPIFITNSTDSEVADSGFSVVSYKGKRGHADD